MEPLVVSVKATDGYKKIQYVEWLSVVYATTKLIV